MAPKEKTTVKAIKPHKVALLHFWSSSWFSEWKSMFTTPQKNKMSPNPATMVKSEVMTPAAVLMISVTVPDMLDAEFFHSRAYRVRKDARAQDQERADQGP